MTIRQTEIRMSDSEHTTDYELLGRMISGSEAAFVALYRRYQGPAYRFALQMSGSKEIAEEVTQEVFLTLIHSGDRYDPSRGPLVSWLLGVARNHVLRCLERESRYVSAEEGELEGDGPGAGSPPETEGPLAELTREDAVRALRDAIPLLPVRYREAIVLCDLQEMSYEDAARALDCAVGTVRSRLHRGRALLATKLRGRERCLS